MLGLLRVFWNFGNFSEFSRCFGNLECTEGFCEFCEIHKKLLHLLFLDIQKNSSFFWEAKFLKQPIIHLCMFLRRIYLLKNLMTSYENTLFIRFHKISFFLNHDHS